MCPLFLIAQMVKAAAGFHSLADGSAEIQLPRVASGPAAGGQLAVNLPGYGLNQLDGPGDFRVLEFRNIPVEDADFRVYFLPAQPRVFQEHLLLHQGLGEDGVDELAVQLRVPLGGAPVLFHKGPEPFPGFLRHGGVGLPLFVIQIHGLAVELEFLLRFLPVLLQLLLPLHLLPGLTAHGLLGNKKAVEGPIEGNLLLPGFGVDGAQGGFHPLPVLKAQGNQQTAGVLRFFRADGQTFHA